MPITAALRPESATHTDVTILGPNDATKSDSFRSETSARTTNTNLYTVYGRNGKKQGFQFFTFLNFLGFNVQRLQNCKTQEKPPVTSFFC